MFERFTDRARRALGMAHQEAMRLRHDHVGTEHLLLGIVKEGSGVAADILYEFNVTLPMIRQKVEELCHGPSSGSPPAKLQQTDCLSRVLNYAEEEAADLSKNYTGTEHLLLGLLREPEGTAARVLAALNLHTQKVRDAALNLLGQSPKSRDLLVSHAMG